MATMVQDNQPLLFLGDSLRMRDEIEVKYCFGVIIFYGMDEIAFELQQMPLRLPYKLCRE